MLDRIHTRPQHLDDLGYPTLTLYCVPYYEKIGVFQLHMYSIDITRYRAGVWSMQTLEVDDEVLLALWFMNGDQLPYNELFRGESPVSGRAAVVVTGQG